MWCKMSVSAHDANRFKNKSTQLVYDDTTTPINTVKYPES